MKVLWSPVARRALAAVKAYIANDDLQAAERVERRILDRTAALASAPLVGRPGPRLGTRELSIPDVQYVVAYRVCGDDILILMLWHSRQSRPRLRTIVELDCASAAKQPVARNSLASGAGRV